LLVFQTLCSYPHSDRSYSSIIYENSYAQTFLKKCEVLEVFKNSIVDLQVGNILVNSDNIWSSLSLPKLESLTIAHENSHHLALHLLRTSKKLKKLAFLSEVPLSQSKSNEIIDCFKEDNELKQLELGMYMSMYLFVHDVSKELKLKLESLVIKQFHHFFVPNIEHFLPTQAQTLKKLDLDFFRESVLKIIVEKMVVLESLKLGSSEMTLDSFTSYEQQNPSVKELNLPSFSIPKVKLLLKIMPNVKTLRLLWVTNKELEAIVRSGRNLEKIFFKENRDESLVFYNELKTRGEEEINANIEFIQS
jgi:hypothetical protein